VAFLRWLAGTDTAALNMLGASMKFDSIGRSKYMTAVLEQIEASRDFGNLRKSEREKHMATLRKAALQVADTA